MRDPTLHFTPLLQLLHLFLQRLPLRFQGHDVLEQASA
jgi:hypothetical protein